MYQIKKHSDFWTILNLESELSRTLTSDEISQVSDEFPTLTDSGVLSLYVDDIRSLTDKP